jgi:urease accessory protein
VQRATSVRGHGHWDIRDGAGTVTLDYDSRHRRRLRLASDAGEAFLLDLPEARHLRDGDGLVLEGGGVLRVVAQAERVLVVRAPDPALLLRLAWHLGNRHLPAALAGDRIVIRPDHVIADMLRGLGAEVTEATAAFDPEQGAYAGAAAHHHHHDGD